MDLTFKKLARVASLTAALLGVSASLGWFLNIPALRSIVPELKPAAVSSALGLILAGTALAVVGLDPERRWKRFFLQFCGVVILALGALTLLKYCTGWNWGIANAPQNPWTPPGRMSALTALNFTLLGLAVAVFRQGRLATPGRWLAGMAAGIGWVAIVAYSYNIESFYRFGPSTSMSVLSAVAFCLLSCAYLFWRPELGFMQVVSSHTITGLMIRRWLPIVLLAPPVIGAVVMAGARQGHYGEVLAGGLFTILVALVFFIVLLADLRRQYALEIAQQQSRDALQESEDRFRQYAESTQDVLWMVDPKRRRAEYLSPSFQQVWGRPCESVMASVDEWAKSIHPEDRPQVLATLPTAAQGKLPSVEYRILRPDGSIRWISDSGFAIRDGRGQIKHIGGIARDITARKEAERDLFFFKYLVEHSNHPFHIISPAAQFRFIYVNEAACRHYGRSAEELLSMRIPDWDPLFDDQRCLEAWAEVKRNHSLVFETIHRHKDGHEIPVEVSANYIKYDGQEMIAGWFHDISARKAAEQALREREELFRSFFNNAAVGASQIDLAGRFIAVNDRLCQIIGYSREELMQLTPVDLTHPDDQEKYRDQYLRFVRGETQVYEVQKRYIRKDKKVIWVQVTGGTVRGPDRRPIRTTAIVQDITKRKQAEETLRHSESLLRQMLELLPIGVWIMNAQGKIVQHNFKALELWGGSRHVGIEQFGEYKGWWLRNGKRIEAEEWAAARALRKGDVTLNEEIEIETFDGKRKIILNSALPLRDAAGAIIGAIITNQDITERQKAEQALRETKEQLARTNERLERMVCERTVRLQETIGELEHFSYTITHDMRAPLRAMQGLGHLLLRQCALNPTHQEWMRRITESADRMDHLITDSLNYTKVVQQGMELHPVHLRGLLQGIINSYPQLQSPQADVSVVGDIPTLLGNEAGLTQCFANLLNNAVKFVNPGTKPRVRIWAETVARSEPEHPAGWVRIWVEDNGIGIAPEHQERIFDMFQRLAKSYEGTGIGLALVRKVVERMDGKVGLESEPGKGSRFWVEFRHCEPDTKAYVANANSVRRG